VGRLLFILLVRLVRQALAKLVDKVPSAFVEGGSLAELTSTIDGEVLASIDKFLYLRKLLAGVNHIVHGRVATAGGIEFFCHDFLFWAKIVKLFCSMIIF